MHVARGRLKAQGLWEERVLRTPWLQPESGVLKLTGDRGALQDKGSQGMMVVTQGPHSEADAQSDLLDA